MLIYIGFMMSLIIIYLYYYLCPRITQYTQRTLLVLVIKMFAMIAIFEFKKKEFLVS